MIKLYFKQGACSLATHITLREAGLPFEIEKVTDGKTASGEEYASINPKGYVATIELDDGSILTENAAILPYIADLVPGKNLAPKYGTMERVRMSEWLAFANSELHPNIARLAFPSTTLHADDKEKVMKKLTKYFGILDLHLKGKEWLAGDSFTVADVYTFVVTNWMMQFKVLENFAAWPNLAKYLERIGERPKVKEAIKAEAGPAKQVCEV